MPSFLNTSILKKNPKKPTYNPPTPKKQQKNPKFDPLKVTKNKRFKYDLLDLITIMNANYAKNHEKDILASLITVLKLNGSSLIY